MASNPVQPELKEFIGKREYCQGSTVSGPCPTTPDYFIHTKAGGRETVCKKHAPLVEESSKVFIWAKGDVKLERLW